MTMLSRRISGINGNGVLRSVRSISAPTNGSLYEGHVPTTVVQKAVLAAGSAAVGLGNPWRADMVAVNGEVTGLFALQSMRERMSADAEGRRVLDARPRISTKTVDFGRLRELPERSFGRAYCAYNDCHNIGPDTRERVRFVDDEELAYVMQRYREIHDLTHTLLDMPTDMVGEVAVKWVEGLQTGLPMCVGGAVAGPARFTSAQVAKFRALRPWAIKVGTRARFLMAVFYEERWEQDLVELRKELGISTPPYLT